jgi:hypothetical protein
MNCPQCKNPIQDNTTECEWCGHKLVEKPFDTLSVNQNKSKEKDMSTPGVGKNARIILGILLFFVWILFLLFWSEF